MNLSRILSKNSFRSPPSSGKISHSEEVSKLKSEIELLKQTIESLKVSVESRDAAIGILAREKEKLFVELKGSQRTNRSLHLELMNERDIHFKEKDFLINAIKRLPKQQILQVNATRNMDTVEEGSIHDEIKKRDEVIFNMGTKYLKIKSSKSLLRQKLQILELENKKICEDIVYNLSENRKNMDILMEKLLKCVTISPSSKNFMRLLQVNADLNYENTKLKILISSFRDSVENTASPWSEISRGIKTLPMEMKSCKRKKHINFVRRKLRYSSAERVRNDIRSLSDSCFIISVPQSF